MKKLVSLILITVLLLSFAASASAVVQAEIDQVIPEVGLEAALQTAWDNIEKDKGKTLEEISDENFANYYHYNPYGHTVPEEPYLSVNENDTWDDIINRLFEKYGIEEGQENLALTYYNTVTGESYSYNADKYFVTASVVKVPVCMLVAEKVSAGEITMDESIYGQPFSYQEFRALAHSDNSAYLDLLNYLGGFNHFRDMQSELMGSDPKDDLGETTYLESFNTARQIEHCLKLLQADPEKYPGVIENMLIDTPYEYFKMWDRRYPTAQKWGYLPYSDNEGQHDFVNNCGIIYTDQPIILVVMTDFLPSGYDVIGEYATLMIDYTNYRIAEYEQKQEEMKEKALEEMKSKDFSSFYSAGELIEADKTQQAETEKKFSMSVKSSILLLAIASAMVFALVFIKRRNKAGRITVKWAVPAIVITGIAGMLCVFALNVGTLSAETEGNPQDTVRNFFNNITLGNYEEAYKSLSDYSSLGLEKEMDTEEGKMIKEELEKSYSFAITEPPVTNKLKATQRVSFRYLDIGELENAASEKIETVLNNVVQTYPKDEIFDDNGEYLPTVSDIVYKEAVAKACDDAQSYYKTTDLTIDLIYENDAWYMVTSPELITALTGGVA